MSEPPGKHRSTSPLPVIENPGTHPRDWVLVVLVLVCLLAFIAGLYLMLH